MKKLQDLVESGTTSVESLINTKGTLSETQKSAFLLSLKEVQLKQQELRDGLKQLGYSEEDINQIADHPVAIHIYHQYLKEGKVLPCGQDKEGEK